MSTNNPVRVLDLFSGIGAFSLGLERAGMRTVAFCEIEPFARRVLARHWPDVHIFHDVRELSAQHLSAKGLGVDLICGGFPCQDISVAGRGAGIGGERSGLWSEFARLIGEIRPRYAIVENVSALLGRGLGDVLGDLAALGYDAEWHCIPASAIGAPHIRDRVWIVAYANQRDLQRRRGESDARDGCQGGETRGGQPAGSGGIADVAYADSRGRREQGDVGEAAGDTGAGQPRDCGAMGIAIGKRPQGNVGRELLGISARGLQSVSRSSEWWAVVSGMGGSTDGPPAWLDRCVGRGLSHDESCRVAAVLCRVWNPTLAQALWRAAGGLGRFQQAQALFAFVRQFEDGSDEARLLVAGKKASETFLRSLRQHAISGSSPHRPRHDEQSGVEHPDTMQPMSRLLARDSKADWSCDSWEDGVARVVNGPAGKVDRRKRLIGLGNSLVPQIPELIGRAIMAYEASASERAA